MVIMLRYTAGLGLMLLLLSACSGSRKTSGSPTVPSVVPGFTIDTPLTQLLGRQVPKGANPQLVIAMVPWMNVPYKYGGSSTSGTDCSGLIGALFPQVYRIHPPRTTAAIYKEAMPVARQMLQEGDLVFFTIETAKPGHAGIYLWNDYFLHASTSRGVIISSLNEPYWNRYFVGGGRLPALLP